MKIKFAKYQGTGNDFVLLQNFSKELPALTQAQVAFLCDRRFGIGADGLIILQPHASFDFEMIYFNADGAQSTMCGNGGRCAAQFAFDAGLAKAQQTFLAIDGPHVAEVFDGGVHLKMIDVNGIKTENQGLFLNTGSPHFIQSCADLKTLDVQQLGAAIRYSAPYAAEGVNVNFVHEMPDGLEVRTYERGVEAETYSCGTGVTAAALAHAWQKQLPAGTIPIATLGGNLEVRFTQKSAGVFENVYLSGPATFVFEGQIDLG